MRRFVLIVVLLLLPFQWAWAAASAYCVHEPSTAASHWGHHEHKCRDAHAKDGKAGSKAAVDADCSVCHLGAMPWLDFAQLPPVLDVPQPVVRIEHHGAFRSYVPSGPERPDKPLAG